MIRTLRKSVLSVPLAAIALAVSSAYAAPVVGPSDATFYTNPAVLGGAHGDLIQYRPATVNLGTGAPATKAFNVLYQSTDSLGKPNAVSGTVLVPTTAWSGTGPPPGDSVCRWHAGSGPGLRAFAPVRCRQQRV